jgi:hypothetical protein
MQLLLVQCGLRVPMSMDMRALQVPDIGWPLLRNPLGQHRFHVFWVHISTHSPAVLTHICYDFPQ